MNEYYKRYGVKPMKKEYFCFFSKASAYAYDAELPL